MRDRGGIRRAPFLNKSHCPQHLLKCSFDVVKRWVNEAQEAASSDNIMVQVRGILKTSTLSLSTLHKFSWPLARTGSYSLVTGCGGWELGRNSQDSAWVFRKDFLTGCC